MPFEDVPGGAGHTSLYEVKKHRITCVQDHRSMLSRNTSNFISSKMADAAAQMATPRFKVWSVHHLMQLWWKP